MGLGAVAGTIVAALKSRGTGPKTNRIKEYLNPETLPVIPPSPKTVSAGTEQTEIKQPKLVQQSASLPAQVEAAPPPPIMMTPEHQSFEDYDR
ncbi:MAG: hypothetical protein QM703_04915 [Gemmatales bacterium]